MLSHRAHDYPFLIKRWRAVARAAGLRLETLALDGVVRVFFLKSPSLALQGGIYLSAGIHGDEPAGTEALIAWAEANLTRLRQLPLLLFPCLNPWGLVNNMRADAHGADLNRLFHLNSNPIVAAMRRFVAPYHFDLALMLHEDFDAQGLYLYEVQQAKDFWGEALLDAARPHIPIEGRAKVDGKKAAAGLIRRKVRAGMFDEMGYPEAIWLHLKHAARSLTLETPSEFGLDQRVRAQVAVIDECVRRVGEGAAVRGESLFVEVKSSPLS